MSLVRPLISTLYRGSLLTDVTAMEVTRWQVAPEDVSNCRNAKLDLRERMAVEKLDPEWTAFLEADSIFNRGATFTPVKLVEGDKWTEGKNSAIAFRLVDGTVAIGRIRRILREKETNQRVVLVLERHRELSLEDQAHDPYRKFPEIDARLLYRSTQQNLEAIRPAQIISHIARCPYEAEKYEFVEPVFVSLVLDRVCLSANNFHT